MTFLTNTHNLLIRPHRNLHTIFFKSIEQGCIVEQTSPGRNKWCKNIQLFPTRSRNCKVETPVANLAVHLPIDTVLAPRGEHVQG